MSKFLDKVRARSEADRKSFAFILSCIITGIIFVIWLLTFQFQLKNNEKPNPNNEQVESLNQQ